MFITLKSTHDGSAITVNLDHVTCMFDSRGGTRLLMARGECFQVEESRAQILAEIARLSQSESLADTVARLALREALNELKAEM